VIEISKIIIELTPKVICYPHKEFPRIGFPSNIQYSSGSVSYGLMDIDQVKTLFANVIEELEALLDKAYNDYWRDLKKDLKEEVKV